jgi:hypothetical protein
MKATTESKVQQEIYIWFNNNYPNLLIHSTPNGGARNGFEAKNLKLTGLVAGIADLTIKGIASRFVDVEVKLPGEKLTNNQPAIAKKLIENQCHYLIVYSLDDFIEKITPLIPFLQNDSN